MKLLKLRKGQGMTEYILIIALIAVLVIGAVKVFGKNVKKGFSDSAEKIGSSVDDAVKNSSADK